MNNIRIVPDTLSRQRGRSNNHAIDRISAKSIAINQRSLVSNIVQVCQSPSRRPTVVSHNVTVQRIGVDGDDRANVVAEVVVQNHGLCTADKNGCAGI